MRREARFFMLFFTAASALWLVMAHFILAAADAGMCDLTAAALYVPEMARAARLSAVLTAAGGFIFDISLRQSANSRGGQAGE